MVLLIPLNNFIIIKSKAKFKFQYGSTDTEELYLCKYFKKSFKFQYGSTDT